MLIINWNTIVFLGAILTYKKVLLIHQINMF